MSAIVPEVIPSYLLIITKETIEYLQKDKEDTDLMLTDCELYTDTLIFILLTQYNRTQCLSNMRCTFYTAILMN